MRVKRVKSITKQKIKNENKNNRNEKQNCEK